MWDFFHRLNRLYEHVSVKNSAVGFFPSVEASRLLAVTFMNHNKHDSSQFSRAEFSHRLYRLYEHISAKNSPVGFLSTIINF